MDRANLSYAIGHCVFLEKINPIMKSIELLSRPIKANR
ncbi:Uncharacterised protein [Legionella moravica]|uniref:Uncharacterized protein n=1 Tax=Legionella moravica TaxID=39962 RepID=A0A378JUM3_9GAMM|nr:Uncharacterised protein [Legionella waltersii]STX62136.1 Uncharacterised protein [Legionella moravica]